MKTRWILSIAAVALVFAGTASAQETPKVESAETPALAATVPVEASGAVLIEDGCEELNYTPAEPDAELASVGAACKPCKNRTWCKCTYNGLPRVSCNPCCYGNLGQIQTCFD